jgi:hypothetical protein
MLLCIHNTDLAWVASEVQRPPDGNEVLKHVGVDVVKRPTNAQALSVCWSFHNDTTRYSVQLSRWYCRNRPNYLTSLSICWPFHNDATRCSVQLSRYWGKIWNVSVNHTNTSTHLWLLHNDTTKMLGSATKKNVLLCFLECYLFVSNNVCFSVIISYHPVRKANKEHAK